MPLQATSARGLLLSTTIPEGRWLFGNEPRVSSCCSSAEQCQTGDLFAVLDEQHLTAQCQVELAIERGAIGILSERPFPNAVPQYIVEDSRVAFAQLCHALAGHPSQSLRTIGITGTYGKTSTERLLAGVLSASARSHSSLDARSIESGGAVHIAGWLAEARANSCQFAIVEASSQALARRQFSGLQLEAAIVTNVRREHTDGHGSLRNYHTAKKRLLDQLKPSGFAVINVDDASSRSLMDEIDCATMTIGIARPADLTATLLERHASEQTFLLDAGDESIVMRTQVIGDGHIYNCLAAAAVALGLGIDPSTIVRGIESVVALPKRLQRVECGQSFGVFIDELHTPPSLGNAIRTLRPICTGNIHCVMGIDHRLSEIARAQIGRLLERSADKCVLTGTRFDRKMSLRTAHEVLDGFDRPAQAHLMPDRAQAICWALAQADPGDVILLAGGVESNGPGDVVLCDEDVTRFWLQHVQQPTQCPWLPA
jgi:UDP-N-acetylmuramoyl-L-alanyl-D-glutamate--2,6-diaminopimelate ligase